MLSQVLICTGLALDIVGVLLLYRFGLPSRYPESDHLALHTNEGDRIQRTRRRRWFRRFSHLGISLLAFGFFLQFLGTLS